MQQVIQRIDTFEERLEERFEKIQDALIRMARTEERTSIILEQNNKLLDNFNDLSKRVAHLERNDAVQRQSISFFERLGWAFATGAVGVAGAVASWWLSR